MAQGPNHDLPDWIMATAAVMGIIATPLTLLGRRIFGSVKREEFEKYLRSRDQLSEQRHLSNTGKLDEITREVGQVRERVSAIEGEMKGRTHAR